MSLTVDARTFRDMVADPAGVETISAASGCELVTVEVRDAAAARRLVALNITAVSAAVLVVAPVPVCLPGTAANAADVILTEDAVGELSGPIGLVYLAAGVFRDHGRVLGDDQSSGVQVLDDLVVIARGGLVRIGGDIDERAVCFRYGKSPQISRGSPRAIPSRSSSPLQDDPRVRLRLTLRCRLCKPAGDKWVPGVCGSSAGLAGAFKVAAASWRPPPRERM